MPAGPRHWRASTTLRAGGFRLGSCDAQHDRAGPGSDAALIARPSGGARELRSPAPRCGRRSDRRRAGHRLRSPRHVPGRRRGHRIAMLIGMLALRESPVFLISRRAVQDVSSEGARTTSARCSPVRALLVPQRRSTTLLPWLIDLAGITLVHFMTSRLPTLLAYRGLSGRDTILSTALFNGSGVAGGLASALLLRRLGPIVVLGITYSRGGDIRRHCAGRSSSFAFHTRP